MRIVSAVPSVLLMTLLILSGCDSLFEVMPDAKLRFSVVEQSLKPFGTPYITIKLEHLEGHTVYNVSCDVTAKFGNVIKGDAFAYFAGGNEIREGEIAQAEAIFFDGIDSHGSYRTLSYKCEWIEYRGGGGKGFESISGIW